MQVLACQCVACFRLPEATQLCTSCCATCALPLKLLPTTTSRGRRLCVQRTSSSSARGRDVAADACESVVLLLD